MKNISKINNHQTFKKKTKFNNQNNKIKTKK